MRVDAFSAVVDDSAFPAMVAMVLMQLTDVGAPAADLPRVREGCDASSAGAHSRSHAMWVGLGPQPDAFVDGARGREIEPRPLLGRRMYYLPFLDDDTYPDDDPRWTTDAPVAGPVRRRVDAAFSGWALNLTMRLGTGGASD